MTSFFFFSLSIVFKKPLEQVKKNIYFLFFNYKMKIKITLLFSLLLSFSLAKIFKMQPRILPRLYLQKSSFFHQVIPDTLLQFTDWRANDDYVQIVQKIKNSKRNESIDQMLSFIWNTFTLDLNNRCKASMNNIDKTDEFKAEVDRLNSIICDDVDDDIMKEYGV